MKRSALLLATWMVLALLASCGGSPSQRSESSAIPLITLAPTGQAQTTSPEPSIPVETQSTGIPSTGGEPLAVPVFASQLLDANVWTQAEGKVGPVAGIVIDSGTGQVRYIIVRGSLTRDMQKANYAVPWQAFQWVRVPDQDQPVLMINLPDSALANAPPLDEKYLTGAADPSFNPEEWNQQLVNYWGSQVKLPDQPAFQGPSIRLVNGLFGGISLPVDNPSGQNLGQVRDLILNTDGQVTYGVLSASSGLNPKKRLIPLPWQALRWDAQGQRFLIELLEGTVRIAPGYQSAKDFPDITQPGWDNDIQAYWRSIPSAPKTADLPPETPTRALQLMGKLVMLPDGTNLGTMENLLFHPDGSVRYLILNLDRGLVPAPLSAFQFNPENNTLIFQGDPAQLAQAPSFPDVTAFPQTTNDPWGQDVDAFWNQPGSEQPGGAALTPTPFPTAQPSGVPAVHETLQPTQQAGIIPPASSSPPALASYIFNQPTYDSQGQPIGPVADIIFQTTGGNHLIVIDMGDRLVPVPWTLFAWDPGQARYVYTGDLTHVNNAPGFSSLDEVRPGVSGWDSLVMNFWNR